MKRILVFTLITAMLLGLCACGASEVTETTAPPEGTEATTGVSYNYPEIRDKLTWEKIQAFPLKSNRMTEDELRQLCADFFIFSKTALWTPNQTVSYQKTKDGDTDEMIMGVVYGGLPYIGVASGNVYRLMDYMDEESGVVDMTEPMENPKLFGNQCSIASYWGWARVINSADFGWTYEMVQSRGFLRVGPYTYPDNLLRFSTDLCQTTTVALENGDQVMYQSYAAMKVADGLVNYTTAGHAMMCTGAPVVVYRDDGTIDGAQSYLLITDQYGNWTESTNEAGDTYQHKNYVNRKFTFQQLFLDGYLPFTFAEFLGTDPIEETQVTFSHTEDTISLKQLMSGTVEANYGISDIYAVVKDAQGVEVYRCAQRAETAGVTSLPFGRAIQSEEWAPYTGGGYTVEISCQLGTGERPILYTGSLTK